MGLVFRGMLGVTVSQILSNHSIVTVKMEGKQLKPWGVFMDKQNQPTFPYRFPKSFSPQMGEKNPRPHLLTFGYY